MEKNDSDLLSISSGEDGMMTVLAVIGLLAVVGAIIASNQDDETTR